jgi:hypothetical protein
MPEGKLETDGRSADRFYSCKPQGEAGIMERKEGGASICRIPVPDG